MKFPITILLLFTSGLIFSQADSIGLKETMQKLEKAFIQKNESDLRILLHKDASYGHSNGWVQSKADILNDLKSGKLIYNKLESSASSILRINNKWATVVMDTRAEGLLNGNGFNLSMYVMQVWMKTKKGWQLLARQSGKK